MCISTVKNIIKYCTKQKSSAHTCFLDAVKAFDRVSHWTLFSKLIDRNVPLVIVRVTAVWFQTQRMCMGKNELCVFQCFEWCTNECVK